MLKITIIDSPTEQTLVLEGRLTELYVSELESVWENARRSNAARRLIVDLRDATYIDRKGESLLLHMKRHGAEFIACGICTTHQLAQLGITCSGMSHEDH